MPETREGQFSLDVSKWCGKANANADKVLRAVCIGLLNNVVTLTPVGNPDLWKGDKFGFIHAPPGYVGGRLRGNWQVTISEPAKDALDTIDPTGQTVVLAARTVLGDAVCGPTVYIINNLPYAIPVEYGHSKQAPQGMVRISVLEYQRIVNEAVRGLQ